ncbi:uncharacterized protein LOC125647641 [Ostrea edulis]|uniref:uncharacterized protein LOC125647641 n=1 Tax=Ostrea edulis TaxID=37623 RepID=UPI00209409C3|nr:uncharacterized protein LOC125647641 [Ostrea edulis]
MTSKMMHFVLSFIVLSLRVVHGIESCRHVQRTNFDTGETRCCLFVQCKPNHYVRGCDVDNTADTCEPCPSGSMLLDHTNSYFPFPCIQYTCPPEARPVDYLSEEGCRLPCKCDENRGYAGEDPCLCRIKATSTSTSVALSSMTRKRRSFYNRLFEMNGGV